MYLALKCLHVLAAIAYLGNIALALVQKLDADRSREPRLMAHALRAVVAGDRWITVPAATVLTASGIAMAVIAGVPLLRTGWLWQGASLLALSGLMYAWPLGPDQRRMLALARAAVAGGAFDTARYRRLSRRWLAFAVASIVLAVGAVVLMVVRPA